MAEIQTLGIKATGNKVSIPNNPIGKLKYYLNVVLGLINVNQPGLLAKLRNYSNSNVSMTQFVELVNICAQLDPKIFMNKCIFLAPELCSGSLNQFYQISQVKGKFAVASDVLVGSVSARVTKIMCCREEWLVQYYYGPLLEITIMIKDAEQQGRQQERKMIKQQAFQQEMRRRRRDKSQKCCSIM